MQVVKYFNNRFMYYIMEETRLKYVKTPSELPPDSNFECPICFEKIDVDESINGVPNCVICARGHRIHNICFKKMSKNECPVCKSRSIYFCNSKLGYSYVPRKGGKKNKTRKKMNPHNKRKTPKKRKTKRNI